MRGVIFSSLIFGFLSSGNAMGSQLLFFEAADSKCSAYSVDFPQTSPKTLWSMAECPDNVIIHDKNVYYSVGKKIFKRSTDWSKSAEQLVAEFPADSGYQKQFWIDKKSRNIKIRYEVLVDAAKVSQSKSNPTDVVFKYRGKSFTTYKAEGSPAMAVAAELRGSQWKTIKEMPTYTETDNSMGVEVLSPAELGPEYGAGKNFFWRFSPNISALDDLEVNQTLMDALSKNKAGRPFAKKMNGKKQLLYYFGELPNGKEAGFSAPIYFCDVPCKKPRQVDVKSNLILSMEKSGSALMFRTSDRDMKVFSVDSEKLMFDKKNIHMSGWLD